MTLRRALLRIGPCGLGLLPLGGIQVPAVAQSVRSTGGGTSGGTLNERMEYTLVRTSTGSGVDRREWVTAVILWRASSESPTREQSLSSNRRAFPAVRRASEDRGRLFIGGSRTGYVRDAEIDQAYRSLWVHGQYYGLALRDSALVVLVDESAARTQPPAIVGTHWIAGAMPDEFWPNTWSSGDTTFIVRPGRQSAILEESLRLEPSIRAFLDFEPPH